MHGCGAVPTVDPMPAHSPPLRAALPLDALRPAVPPAPGRLRRALHRVAVVLGWAVGCQRVPHLDRRLQLVFPWALGLAIGIPMAAVFDGPIRSVAAGACGGFILGGMLAWAVQRSTSHRATAQLLDREVELLRYADDRAGTVARQFAWAIDDLLVARCTLRERDARLDELAEELAQTRSLAERRDRELADATQKVFEVGLFDVDRMRAQMAELEQAATDLGEVRRRADEENTRVKAELDAATRRIAGLSGALRKINEVTSGAQQRGTEPEELSFRWKLEFDGKRNALRMKLLDERLAATAARVLEAEETIAVSETTTPAAGVPSASGDQLAGWQSLIVNEAIAGRFRASSYSELRFQFLVEGQWLPAVPEVTAPADHGKRARVWAIDARRAGRKIAV